MHSIDNIVHPRKALPEVLKKVLPLYVRDYGTEYVNLILKRLYDAIYIFDSNPIDTWKFVCEHSDEIKDKDFCHRSKIEYYDYIDHEYRIDCSNEKIIRKFFKKAYEMKASNNYSIMKIDFDSYSLKSNRILASGTEEEKREILDRRNAYKEQCLSAGISPITVPSLVEELSLLQSSLLERKKDYLIRNTKWANRIRKDIHDIYHFDISFEGLKNNLFDEGMASTCIEENNKQVRTIMTFPMIKDFGRGSLDNILFHELRHVVETGNKICGFYSLRKGKYEMINEIHTEKNALDDAEKLSNITFFSKSRRNKRSYYEKLFPYLGTLFEDYKMTFDMFGFHNRVDLLEEALGDRFLKNLEFKLHNVEEFEKGDTIRLKRNV